MGFILKMAWRDSRASRRRLLLFSFSVVLGIAALVAVGSFSENLRWGIEDQAKGLLGADLAVQSRVALTEEAQAFLDGLGGEQAREISFSSMIVFPSSGNQTRLVSVRAMEGAYPFYGEFLTAPLGAQERLAAEPVAILEESLLSQFGISVGDPIRLGESTFTVAGALKKIPGESAAVALLSPRVFIPMRALPETGLLNKGSLVRYKTYFKFAEGSDVERLVRDLRSRFRELRLSFDTVEERKRELGRTLENVYSFLSLVGFVALFLGAIGVASAIHVYVQQKISTVAVLRCLGASARQSFAVYLVQGLGLGLVGAAAGAALGIAVQLVLPSLVRDLMPFEVAFSVAWSAVLQGVGAGLVICLLFTLLPLLAIRRVSPLAAIRSAFGEATDRADPWRWILYGVIALTVTGFAVFQAPRWTFGLGFAAGLGVSLALLAGLARGVSWLARRACPRWLPYVVRQGVANLYRPNNRTVLLLLSLGLGTFLALTLILTRSTLLNQISGSIGTDRPNLLFFDIQDDQMEPLERVLAASATPVRARASIVTMRLAALKGRSVEEVLRDRNSGIPNWTLRREYRSTYRGHLTHTEKVVAGEFVPRVEGPGAVPISLEVGLARDMQVGVGDELTFDVQGVPIECRISSLREVEWQRMEPNFFVVFPEGVLEEAPKFFVAATRVESPAESARVQQAVVRDFPNVSAIDLALVIQTLDNIFGKIALVIQFMALFTVLTGILVLVGAVLTGKFQRIRETVLLRTLGAARRQLMQIQLVEYAVLGGLAAITGGVLAWAANVALAIWVFSTPWVAPLGQLAAAVGVVATITLLIGLLTNRGVASHPPLEVLRQET